MVYSRLQEPGSKICVELFLVGAFKNTSFFHTQKHGRLLLHLVYVEDIFITGKSVEDVQQVIKDLNDQFDLNSLGTMSYFFGFEVARTPSGLHLSQTIYATELLHKTNMENAKSSPTPMCLNSKLSLNDMPSPSLLVWKQNWGFASHDTTHDLLG